MMERIREFKGVHAGPPAEQLSDGYSPASYNTALALGGSALELRPGLRAGGFTARALDSFTEWIYYESGSTYWHQVGLDDQHQLWAIGNPPIQITGVTVPGGNEGCRWAVAGNRLFGVAPGSGSFKVYRKTGINTLYGAPVGISAPEAAPSYVSSVAGSGELSGEIDVAVAWYNSYTGTESSRSPLLTRTVTSGYNLTISVAGLTPPTEVTHLRVYIRKQTIQTKLWRNAEMSYAWPIVGNQVTLDFTDEQLNAMVTEAPDEVENDPPPIGLIDLCWWQSRMFATDGGALYYSKLGNPEQWDPESIEQVNPTDGQRIRGIFPIREGILGIFKDRSIYALSGDSPQTWKIELVTAGTGLLNADGLTQLDGVLYGWDETGPWKWPVGEALPQTLTEEVAKPRALAGTLTLRSTGVLAAADPVRKRVLFVPSVTDRWTVLPYNAQEGKWEALGWDLGAVGSMTGGKLQTGERGILLTLGDGIVRDLDWAASPGTAYPIVSGTTSTLTITGTVNGTGDGAFVDGARQTVEYRTYTAAGSSVTVNSPLSAVPGTGSYFLPGGIVAQWTSKILEAEGPEVKKRYIWVGARPEGLAGRMALWINSVLRRTWPIQDRGRVAGVGTNAQMGLIYWTRGRLHEIHLRGEARHDRR